MGPDYCMKYSNDSRKCCLSSFSISKLGCLRLAFIHSTKRYCIIASFAISVSTSKKQKSVNPALRSMFVELEKYIQAYQFLYRFVAYVDLPPKCLQSILEQEAIHLASLIFLENALALEVQVEATEKKEVTGSNVFMREEDGEFAIKWKKHLSFLKKKEDDHLVFQAFRCSW